MMLFGIQFGLISLITKDWFGMHGVNYNTVIGYQVVLNVLNLFLALLIARRSL